MRPVVPGDRGQTGERALDIARRRQITEIELAELVLVREHVRSRPECPGLDLIPAGQDEGIPEIRDEEVERVLRFSERGAFAARHGGAGRGGAERLAHDQAAGAPRRVERLA
jgi:hypothetical protein